MDDYYPLHKAIREGRLNRVCHVFAGEDLVDIESRDEGGDGLTPLQLAAKLGHCDIVQELIRRGANINATGRSKWTALHYAANSGDLPDEIRELIRRGANINAPGRSNWTGLQWARHFAFNAICAAKPRHLWVVMRLVEGNAHIEFQNSCGRTAVHLATLAGRLDIVWYLFNKGANMNAQDLKGRTPLYLAIESNDTVMATHLVRMGAAIDRETDGRPLLRTAIRCGESGMADLLVRMGVTIDDLEIDNLIPLRPDFDYDDFCMVSRLLKARAFNNTGQLINYIDQLHDWLTEAARNSTECKREVYQFWKFRKMYGFSK